MMLFWKIRYFDRSDKQFKDRCLFLHTQTLDPLMRAAVELIARNDSSRLGREILKYRYLFTEENPTTYFSNVPDYDVFCGVGPSEYHEDETGKEIPLQELAPILTGSPTARFIPHGARQHDIDLWSSEPKPFPIAEVSLKTDEVRLLGYFVRDFQEVVNSALMKDGPGTLTMSYPALSPDTKTSLKTAVSDDEIRSFVTIFRRLYMKEELANFQEAVKVFVAATGDHPYSKWVEEIAKAYQARLDSTPGRRPFIQPGTCTFNTKRLIDVFLYTQYAHQPDGRRQRQFADCLREVHDKRAVLTWMFLTELWECSLEIGNAGRVIAWWFKAYCDHHGITPDVVNSLRYDLPGLGAGEKAEDRRKRLFAEQAEKLAVDLWEQAGRPQGGHTQFLVSAREQLTQLLNG